MTIYSHCLYWIHLPDHTDIRYEGYIGVTKNPKRRFAEHKTMSKNGYNTNPYLGRIIEKYGTNINFTTVFYGTEDACYELEDIFRPTRNIGWNINKGGTKPPSNLGKPRKEETKKRISDKLKGHVVSDETRNKISEKNKDRTCSEDTKQKISNAFKGKKRSSEVGDKISKSKKGKPGKSPSIETRRSVSEKLKNRKFSDESIKKMSEVRQNYWATIKNQSV